MSEINSKEEEEILKQGEKLFHYRKLLQRGLVASLIVVFIIGLILKGNSGRYFMIISGLIILGISVTLQTYFWKCPKCKLNFQWNFDSTRYMTHCPYCGVRLRK